MTLVSCVRAVISRCADSLEDILNENVAIAIWQREPPAGMSTLAMDRVSDVRLHSSLPELPAALSNALDAAGYGQRIARHALLTDILALAHRFAAILSVATVEIRLQRVDNDACRKFHADYVSARLITTYLGEGTQWLEAADPDDCDHPAPDTIRQLAPGDVGLFKGRHWSPPAPAVHRSPPIEGSGTVRLLLVINPGDN